MASSLGNAGPDFGANAELLVRLHDLIREGQGDGEEADALRDQMDVCWCRLSTSEEEAIRGLSADLYSIGEGDAEASPTATPLGGVPTEFVGAVQRGDWFEVLRILREHQGSFPRSDLQWIRGVCWAHLRQLGVAIRFFAEAARLRPLKPDEEVWVLTVMMQAKRTADVFPRAEQIARTESDPSLLLKAAEVVSTRAAELSGERAEALRRAAIDIAKRGLRLAKTKDGSELLTALVVGANLLLAFDHEAIGDIGEAMKYCDEALRLDPTNATAMMLRAWLNRNVDLQAAYGDVRRGLSSGLTETLADMRLMPLAHVADTL